MMEIAGDACRDLNQADSDIEQSNGSAMPAFSTIDEFTRWSRFSTARGCEESFLVITSPEGASFDEALAELLKCYSSALGRAGLSDSTAVFSRLYLSDILNQKEALVRSALFNRLRASCALSIIEQVPVAGGPVALLSYHIREARGAMVKKLFDLVPDGWRNDLLVAGRNYSLLLSANHTGGGAFDAYTQTTTIFGSLDSLLGQNGMNLLDNAVRTWVYVRDIDNHYKDMVRARREHFSARGLTDKTRYLASTGIMGMTHAPGKIVSMDSLSIGGLAPGQIVRMEAHSHLSPTILYGVTFERGLRVRFGDRSHLYISGTASIDCKGEVLHPGDAEAQTRRTLENVCALLAEQGATLDSLVYVIAYVRNSHDRHRVGKVLAEKLPEKTPLVFAQAAVCRPSWLMELEGLAIIPDKTGFPPFL